MPKGSKIATCNYCGTRAVLTLQGTVRHELACSACGAPLHDMKSLKTRADVDVKPSKPAKPAKYDKRSKPPKKKKRKSLGERLLGEAFDMIEDFFD